MQSLFSEAFGPIKYLPGEVTDYYGAADAMKGVFRKGHDVKVLSSLGRNNNTNQLEN
jgi:hypothetical protein